MTTSKDNQGRTEDVPMPEVRWDLVALFGCSALFSVLAIAGMVFGGWPFFWGLLLMGVGAAGATIWAFQNAAPW